MTIQGYIRKNYPNHWNSGKWGCHVIEPIGEGREDRLRKSVPHGFKVQVSKYAYWVWLDKD